MIVVLLPLSSSSSSLPSSSPSMLPPSSSSSLSSSSLLSTSSSPSPSLLQFVYHLIAVLPPAEGQQRDTEKSNTIILFTFLTLNPPVPPAISSHDHNLTRCKKFKGAPGEGEGLNCNGGGCGGSSALGYFRGKIAIVVRSWAIGRSGKWKKPYPYKIGGMGGRFVPRKQKNIIVCVWFARCCVARRAK